MSIYRSRYRGEEVDSLLDKIKNLPDLSNIQEVLDKKVDIVVGKQLSDENFTKQLKEKLENIKASDVSYNNTNVEEALTSLLSIPPNITSFTIENPTRELGQEVKTITFNWAIDRLSQVEIQPYVGKVQNSPITYILTTPITQDTTFTLSIKKHSVSKQATLKFLSRVHWFSSDKENISREDIIKTQNTTSVLSSSRQLKKNFNCSGGKYIYFCIPRELCSDDNIVFTAFGLETTFNIVEIPDYTNYYNYNVPMNVYRSLEKQYSANIEIKVS